MKDDNSIPPDAETQITALKVENETLKAENEELKSQLALSEKAKNNFQKMYAESLKVRHTSSGDLSIN